MADFEQIYRLNKIIVLYFRDRQCASGMPFFWSLNVCLPSALCTQDFENILEYYKVCTNTCILNKLYWPKQTKNSFSKYGDCDRKRYLSNFARKLLFLLVYAEPSSMQSLCRGFLIKSRDKKKGIRRNRNSFLISGIALLSYLFSKCLVHAFLGFQKAMNIKFWLSKSDAQSPQC